MSSVIFTATPMKTLVTFFALCVVMVMQTSQHTRSFKEVREPVDQDRGYVLAGQASDTISEDLSWTGKVAGVDFNWKIGKIEELPDVLWDFRLDHAPPLSPGEAVLTSERYLAKITKLDNISVKTVKLRHLIGTKKWFYVIKFVQTTTYGVSNPILVGVNLTGKVIPFRREDGSQVPE